MQSVRPLRLSTLTRPGGSQGFTLVELMVVIAIILVLIAMLMPSLRTAKEMAERVYCANNFKQIGLASIGFADDHEGRLPKHSDATGVNALGVPDKNSHYLPNLVFLGYLPTTRITPQHWQPSSSLRPAVTTSVAVCPSVKGEVSGNTNQDYHVDGVKYSNFSYYPKPPKPAEWGADPSRPNGHITTYAFSAWLGWGSDGYPVAEFPGCAARRFADAGGDRFLATDGTSNGLVWRDSWWDTRAVARHQRGMNLMFLDMHVEYRKDKGRDTLRATPEWHDERTKCGKFDGYWQKYYW